MNNNEAQTLTRIASRERGTVVTRLLVAHKALLRKGYITIADHGTLYTPAGAFVLTVTDKGRAVLSHPSFSL